MKNICYEVKKQGRFTHLDEKTKLYMFILCITLTFVVASINLQKAFLGRGFGVGELASV